MNVLADPPGWQTYTLGDLLEFSNGINADKSAYGEGIPFANVFEIIKNDALYDEMIPGRIAIPSSLAKRYLLRYGDLLFNRTSETQEDLGLASVFFGRSPTVFGGFVFRGHPKTTHMDVNYSRYVLRSSAVREQVVARGQGAIRANVGQRDLRTVRVLLPEISEQRSIAAAISGADELTSGLARLVTKKQAVGRGIAQQLLTGRTRLTGFDAPWTKLRLREVLVPRSELNDLGEDLEVLSCTKHLGFVRSLDYFKSQVFSRDLSGYRVIHRGDIGYPSNHVEEGSIGVQDIVDRGLVSPIYIVMSGKSGVDTFFVQRQLKLDSFKQEFARVTNASVNRRGSLRWNEFSQIAIRLPEPKEQLAISTVLRAVETEIAVLQARWTKAKAVQLGMKQELLSGRTRIPVREAAA